MNFNTKIFVDVLMIIGMFFSMSLQLFGAGTHKLIGLATFLLFLVHNVLNRKWYRALWKGKYRKNRILHTLVNLFVMISMIGIMASGFMLAKEMANGAISGQMTAGRVLHLISSYAECVGIAVHIGLHLKGRKNNVG